MSLAPMRICTEPGCPSPTRKGRCSRHAKAKVQAYDRQRGTASERGYGADWSRWRKATLRDYDLSLCGDRPPMAPATDDSLCLKQGMLRPGNDLDHIQPITGKDDPRRFDPSNVQFLCDSEPNFCHSRKRQRESTQARMAR